MTDKEKVELINRARTVQRNSYAPYSKFHVGAALRTESGKIYTGTNVENASYGLTICAERAAIFNAISEGQRRLTAIAITSSSDRPIPPCGACRQVISEFSDPTALIIMAGEGQTFDTRSIDQLLPFNFVLKSRKEE